MQWYVLNCELSLTCHALRWTVPLQQVSRKYVLCAVNEWWFRQGVVADMSWSRSQLVQRHVVYSEFQEREFWSVGSSQIVVSLHRPSWFQLPTAPWLITSNSTFSSSTHSVTNMSELTNMVKTCSRNSRDIMRWWGNYDILITGRINRSSNTHDTIR